ncbi:hypothetical protein GCM10010302_61770 [Streptomyces polychromogenes]|uniref:Uncharacterized protein n=1 Tax=Streptomyces polychromogenes TaxID=67342 RepID=A0ABN0VPU7_9ACTN
MTVEQICAALAALGLYDGENTPEEHARRAAEFAGPEIYRLRLLSTLLGAVQGRTKLADEAAEDGEDLFTAWFEQLKAAGVWDEPAKQMDFLSWQVRRVGVPLYMVAQDPGAGPLVVAASRAGEFLHTVLGVIAAVDTALARGDNDTIVRQVDVIKVAREFLADALENTDRMLESVTPSGT